MAHSFVPIGPQEATLAPSVHHRRLVERTTPRLGFTEGADVTTWQADLRGELGPMVAIPEKRGPLEARTEWRLDTTWGTVERIRFHAEPGADVVGYLCLPRSGPDPASGAYPVMICLQGHSSGAHNSIGRAYHDESTVIDVPGDRDFAVEACRRGYAALCLEQRSFGQRAEWTQPRVSDYMCLDTSLQALLLGRTLLGERLLDVDRGIDYLDQRGDIDMSRIGLMGNSGGGVVTMYGAALLDRIAFAMPSCAFCTFDSSLMSVYHCACNYIPGLLTVAEAADVTGLFAPKPIVIVAGRTDPVFPLHGVEAGFASLQRIYAAAGAPDRCRLVIGEGGHRFYAEQGWNELGELLAR
ncbi:alpha/beta hydrolase family protein [Propionibacteriaceae bacterium Y2011]